jgi:hypothetical protein
MHDPHSNWSWAEASRLSYNRSQRRRRRAKLRYRITTALLGLMMVGLAAVLWRVLA